MENIAFTSFDVSLPLQHVSVNLSTRQFQHAEFVELAEGVEEPDQLAFLNEHDCCLFQGYLFSQPLPAQELTALMRPGKKKLAWRSPFFGRIVVRNYEESHVDRRFTSPAGWYPGY